MCKGKLCRVALWEKLPDCLFVDASLGQVVACVRHLNVVANNVLNKKSKICFLTLQYVFLYPSSPTSISPLVRSGLSPSKSSSISLRCSCPRTRSFSHCSKKISQKSISNYRRKKFDFFRFTSETESSAAAAES